MRLAWEKRPETRYPSGDVCEEERATVGPFVVRVSSFRGKHTGRMFHCYLGTRDYGSADEAKEAMEKRLRTAMRAALKQLETEPRR